MAGLLKSAKQYYFYFMGLGFTFSAGYFCCTQKSAQRLSDTGSC